MKSILFIFYSIVLCLAFAPQASAQLIIPNAGQWDKEIIAEINSGEATMLLTETGLIDRTDYTIGNTTPIVPMQNVKIQSIVIDSSKYFNYFIGGNPANYRSKVYPFENMEVRFDNDYTLSCDKFGKIELSSHANSFPIQKIKYDASKYLLAKKNDNKYELSGKSKVLLDKEDVLQSDDIMVLPGSPILYSSFLGGSSYDDAETVHVDSLRNIYLCGYTSSSNFPVSDSAYSKENKSAPFGYSSCFIAKFDSSGRMKFSTFWGGYWDDYAKDFKIDKNGDFVIAGYTASRTTFPRTPGAFDTLGNAGYDGFVSKISADGKQLLYSTTIGGDKDDYILSMDLDTNNNPFVVGYTTQTGTYPITNNAVQKVQGGKYDVFVSKLNSNVSGLIYSTFLGGSEDDLGQDIVIDSTGNAYIVGMTRSQNFPLSFNAYSRLLSDTAQGADGGDIFISKISADGTILDYSTYIGGASKDVAYSAILDSLGKLYIAGYSESFNFPTTDSAYSREYSSGSAVLSKGDIVCMKLDLSVANPLQYSTYIGGFGTDRVWTMDLDDSLNVLLTGTTNSLNFPTTPNAIDTVLKDADYGADAFISKLSTDGRKLIYSTYLGGSGMEVGKSAIFINDTLICAIGITSSIDFPTTKNAFDSTYNDISKNDIYTTIFQIKPYIKSLGFEIDAFGILSDNRIVACEGDSVLVTIKVSGGVGSPTIVWNPTNGVRQISQQVFVVKSDITQDYAITVYDILGNKFSDTLHYIVSPSPNTEISGPRIVKRNTAHVYNVEQQSGCTYLWNCTGGTILSGQYTHQVEILWADVSNSSLVCAVINSNQCEATSGVVSISVGNDFSIELTHRGSYTMCNGDTLYISPLQDYPNYLWSNGFREKVLRVTGAGRYWLKVTDANGFNGYSDTVTILTKTSPPKPIIKLVDDYLQCNVVAPKYQWYINGFPIEGANQKSYKIDRVGAYQVEITANNQCRAISDAYGYSAVSESEECKLFNYNTDTEILSIFSEDCTIINAHFSMYDAIGQLLYSGLIDQDRLEINMNQFAETIVFIRIILQDGSVMVKKIVK